MGFYMLNLVADTTDPFPQNISENLSYNDQESIIEIFVEKILGYENAITEQEDSDTEEHNLKKNLKFEILFSLNGENTQRVISFSEISGIFKRYDAGLNSGFLSNDSPPPNI